MYSIRIWIFRTVQYFVASEHSITCLQYELTGFGRSTKRKEKCLGGHRQRTRSTHSKDVFSWSAAFVWHLLCTFFTLLFQSKTYQKPLLRLETHFLFFHKMFAMRDQTTMRLPILLPITALLVAKSHAYCNWNGCNGVVQGGEWCNESTDRCETGCQVRFVETIPACPCITYLWFSLICSLSYLLFGLALGATTHSATAIGDQMVMRLPARVM
jgi:hypothetical protein